MENENRPAGCDRRPADELCSGEEHAPNSITAPRNQPKPKLRAYQLDIIEQVRTLAHPLIQLPTGAGKTIIAAAIIDEAIASGQRVLFLAHRRELVFQASRKLLARGIGHAIMMGAESSEYIGQRCIVGSVPTVHARAIRNQKIDLPPADLIIIDEAHHARARTYVEIRKAYPHAKIIGLTATPARGDGRGLGGDLFSDLVKVPTYAWLIERGYLVLPVVFAPVMPDLAGVKTLGTGDYSPGQLEARMDANALVGGIVDHWFKLGQDRRTICFTSGVKHSAHLCNEFKLAGVEAAHLDHSTETKERQRIIDGFQAGQIKLITNCGILVEGYDEPSASCLVLARPTKLLPVYRQMVGRVLRPYDGKVDARILDHSGAVYRHGYPDDEIEWTLVPDKQAVNKSAASRALSHKRELTTCPKCAAVRLEGNACRVCGWKPTPKPVPLEVRDGHLGHVKRDRSVHVLSQNEQGFYQEILFVSRAKNWKPGAAHAAAWEASSPLRLRIGDRSRPHPGERRRRRGQRFKVVPPPRWEAAEFLFEPMRGGRKGRSQIPVRAGRAPLPHSHYEHSRVV